MSLRNPIVGGRRHSSHIPKGHTQDALDVEKKDNDEPRIKAVHQLRDKFRRKTLGPSGSKSSLGMKCNKVDVSLSVGKTEFKGSNVSDGFTRKQIEKVLNEESGTESNRKLAQAKADDIGHKVLLNLTSQYDVTGHDSKTVAAMAKKSAKHLETYLKKFGTGSTVTKNDETDEGELAERSKHKSFQNTVTQLLRASSFRYASPDLRQQSSNIYEEFASAEGLLSDGVDKYVEAVHSVLKTGLDESVNIFMDDVSYGFMAEQNTTSKSIACFIPQLFFYALKSVAGKISPRILIQPEQNKLCILKHISAIFKPGKTTLLLGPPGSGKTTLLKLVSGNLHCDGTHSFQEGQVQFNGRVIDSLKNVAAWVSYTGEEDKHHSNLTVKEVLDFAFNSRKKAMYSDKHLLQLVEQYSGPGAVSKLALLKDLEVEIAIALLGLTDCKDTPIGKLGMEGISGGERRRATLGEMLVTGSQVMCCDEISTGLDSSATFDIVAYLKSTAHVLKKSIIISLLQPSPEIINLFDNVMVLSEGQTIYHGAVSNVRRYFNDVGYDLIDGKDLGDFITDMCTENRQFYLMDSNELALNGNKGLVVPQSTDSMANIWKDSELYKAEMNELRETREIHNRASLDEGYFDYDDTPARSFWRGLGDTLLWSIRIRLRDKYQVIFRFSANALVGLFFGSLFWKLEFSDWWLKSILFLMALMFLASAAFPIVQTNIQQRPIFYKQLDAKFFTPTQLALSLFIVEIPFFLFDVCCFGSIVYWMCGLTEETSSFIIFLCVCTSFALSITTLFSLLAFLCKSEENATVAATLFIATSVVSSGALRAEMMIPEYLRWFLWINPVSWSYRALAVNEYKSPKYDTSPCKFDMLGTNITVFRECSDFFLESRGLRTDQFFVLGAIGFNLLFSFVFLICSILALQKIRFRAKKLHALRGFNQNLTKLNMGQNTDEKNTQRSNSFSFMSRLQLAASSKLYKNPTNSLNKPLLWEESTLSGKITSKVLDPLPPDLQKTVVVHNLWYTISINNEQHDMLKDVSFVAKPGRLFALMGPSGAGKTTLLDIIGGKKNFKQCRGSIFVNGLKQKMKQLGDILSYSAYIEQITVHAPYLTVTECVEFSAGLRLKRDKYFATSVEAGCPVLKLFNEAKQRLVCDILNILELESVSQTLVKYLTPDQMKRLTIGVELVSNPSLILCDEPTSGLDARSASIVMKVLKKISSNGRTVICTVHQPSTHIFNAFDDLLLLKRGGEVVFCGEIGQDAKILKNYFQAIPGTAVMKSGANPSTWMLNLISQNMGSGTSQDFTMLYRTSKQRKEVENHIADILRAHAIQNVSETKGEFQSLEGALKTSMKKHQFVRSGVVQCLFLVLRDAKTYWRDTSISFNRLSISLVFACLFSGFFFQAKLQNVDDLVAKMTNVFFFAMLSCMYNLYTFIPFLIAKRQLYLKERRQGIYSSVAYCISQGVVEIPLIVSQLILTIPAVYVCTGLNQTDWFPIIYYVAIIFLLYNIMTSIGILSTSIFANPILAQLSSILVLLVLMIFCGIIVPLNRLPVAYTPMYYLSFFKYSSEGLISTQFHGVTTGVCVPEGFPWNESNPSIITDMLKLIHTYVNDDIPVNLCTVDGSLDLNPLTPWHNLQVLKNITGLVVPAEEFLLKDFVSDYKYENRWLDLQVLVGWIVTLRGLALLFAAKGHRN